LKLIPSLPPQELNIRHRDRVVRSTPTNKWRHRKNSFTRERANRETQSRFTLST